MKTLARLPLLLTVLAVASVAFAGDAKTYKFAVGTRWKVGQVATRTEKHADHQGVLVTLADGTVVQDKKSDTATTFVRVEKCTEADADGKWVKGLVYFSEWTQTSGEEKDETLKGVVIELSGAQNAHAWKTVSEGAALSDSAKAWFDKEMGSGSHDEKTAEMMDPKKEIAVGESWTPDIKGFVEMMSGNLPIDAEKADCKITLKAVDGGDGTIDVDFKFPTKGLPNPQTQTTMAWSEGGTLTVTGKMTRGLDGMVGPETGSMDHAMKGVASDPTAGVKVTLDISGHKEGVLKLGGEIPAAAPAKPQ